MIENPFDTPIPGQSLTDTPGNGPWEHPPQFTNIDDASEYVWKKIHSEKQLGQIITFLNNGIPVEAIARMILFSGLWMVSGHPMLLYYYLKLCLNK